MFERVGDQFAHNKGARNGRVPRRWSPVVAGVFCLVLVAGAVFWSMRRKPPSAPGPLDLKQRQLTTNTDEDSVEGPAISPDGKYLAYSDLKGIHIKLLATGETETIAQPQALNGHQAQWELRWFPDGTRLLANPAGPNVPFLQPSIWTLSVVGGAPQKIRDDATPWAVSPDGSLIAFTTNPGRIGDREIWLMGPSGEQARKLYETDENSSFGNIQWSPEGQRFICVTHRQTADQLESVIESRDLKGGPPTRVLSAGFGWAAKGALKDLCWLPNGRLIYALGDPDLNGATCNYWEMPVDTRTGEPRGTPRQLTNSTGFCMNGASATADGKRLVFMKWWVQHRVYIADLEASATRIGIPRRLTASEGNEVPLGWTADSKAVLFLSNRSGPWSIFKQSLDENVARLIATGTENAFVGNFVLSSDGAWVNYSLIPNEIGFSKLFQLMRVPIGGGSPRLVLSGRLHGLHCAKSPATQCVFGEWTPNFKQLIFTGFDPVRGRGRELIRINVDRTEPDAGWDLSPDGTRIAVVKYHEGRIQLLSLTGRAEQEISLKHWVLESIKWAADGKGLFLGSRTEQSTVLLYVDLQGNAHVLWEQRGRPGTRGIPSPDGHHLAITASTLNSNVWMIENF